VTVYNVNTGHNREIVERSESLNGYAVFIERVRHYQATGLPLEEAIKKAVDDCVSSSILTGFLNNLSSEVRNMLFTEFKLDDAIVVWREEGFEKGVEEGRKEGREEGIEIGIYKVAKNMIAFSTPPEQVAAATGLPLDEVVKLSKKGEH
jgi:flagellar biosynthesis/type III secretory pathway protein FliH